MNAEKLEPPAKDLETDRLTWSIDEAADLLGISRASAYEAARTGQIPTIKLGRRILVPVTALQRMLAAASKGAL